MRLVARLVAIVDLVTTRHFNLYSDLMELIGQTDPSLGDEPPALYASRNGDSGLLENWMHPLELGRPLPTLPLWLAENLAIPLELEPGYEETRRASSASRRPVSPDRDTLRDAGLVRLDDRAVKYAPNIGNERLDNPRDRLAEITIRHPATMTAGFDAADVPQGDIMNMRLKKRMCLLVLAATGWFALEAFPDDAPRGTTTRPEYNPKRGAACTPRLPGLGLRRCRRCTGVQGRPARIHASRTSPAGQGEGRELPQYLHQSGGVPRLPRDGKVPRPDNPRHGSLPGGAEGCEGRPQGRRVRG